MRAVILAAGVGSRLGRPYPKSLSRLPSGETILGKQIRILRKCDINDIIVVVGFKMSLIMETFPDVLYKYNPVYYITNTSKSLLCAIKDIHDDVIWTNGDVIFDEEVVRKIVESGSNAIAVNNSKCGQEEVKYKCNNKNNITAISKHVQEAQGEAVGVNKIIKRDIEDFKNALNACKDNDYFEKAIELLISHGKKFQAVDISSFRCIEVDFEEDLNTALNLFSTDL